MPYDRKQGAAISKSPFDLVGGLENAVPWRGGVRVNPTSRIPAHFVIRISFVIRPSSFEPRHWVVALHELDISREHRSAQSDKMGIPPGTVIA